MENIIIKTDNSNIIVYIEDNKIWGYQFNYDNSINYVDDSIFKYFEFLKCSDNCLVIGEEDGYEIRLDKETGFKHYFKDGISDIKMFYLNNGEDATVYLGGDKNEVVLSKTYRLERLKCSIVSITMLAMGMISLSTTLLDNASKIANDYQIPLKHIESISVDDIKDKIFSSNLTDGEKNYLYNEDLLISILPLVNESAWMKYLYDQNFTNIHIASFDESEPVHETVIGYYSRTQPNCLHLRDYNEESCKDTLAHEFVHLCQSEHEYNLIIEACAEIISNEYFEQTHISAYFIQIKLVKELMEIIGPDAVWYYNFTGDFSKIEERVKPYLSNEEYNKFLSDLKFEKHNEEKMMPKYNELENLLDNLYEKIYGSKVDTDEAIMAIKNDRQMQRYYFNAKYINQENSYYYDEEEHGINYTNTEAYAMGLTVMRAEVKIPVYDKEGKLVGEKRVYENLTYDDLLETDTNSIAGYEWVPASSSISINQADGFIEVLEKVQTKKYIKPINEKFEIKNLSVK